MRILHDIQFLDNNLLYLFTAQEKTRNTTMKKQTTSWFVICRIYEKKLYRLCSILLMTCLLLPVTAFSQEKLLVGYCEWGNYGGEDKPDHGYYVDLVAQILRLSGYDVETKIYPWKRAIRMAREHKVDVLPGVWLDENQYPFLQFFQDVVLNYDLISFFVTENSPIENGMIQNMKGKIVGFYRSGAYGSKLFNEKAFKRYEIKGVDQAIKMLFAGRIDSYLADVQTTETVIKNELPQFIGKYKILEPPFITKIVVPAIDRNHPNKVEIIEKFTMKYSDLKKTNPDFFSSLIKKHDVVIKTKPRTNIP